jgi:predicted permease
MNSLQQLLSDLRVRVRSLTGRNALRDRVDEELQFHVEMRTQQLIEAGRTPEQASREARRSVGNPLRLRETALDMWKYGSLEQLWKDVAHAVRVLLRAPGFTTVAVLSLALGIGANAAIFSLIDRVMLRVLPVEDPRDLVVVSSVHPYSRYEFFKTRNGEVFSGVFGFTALSNVGVDGSEQNNDFIQGRLVTGDYFDLLGVPALIGRTLGPDDNRTPGAHPQVVISYAFWQRHFGADPSILGRTIRLSAGYVSSGFGTSGFEPAVGPATAISGEFEVIGVMPAGFIGETVGQHPDFWAPMMMQEHFMPGRPWLRRKTAYWLRLMARLEDGVSREQALATVNVWYQQALTDERGAAASEDEQRRQASERLNLFDGQKGYSPLRNQAAQPLIILMTMVAVVLLIACANLANLLMARGAARAREIGMRIAIGASRGRIVCQLLTESLVLAIAGGVVAVAVAWWGSQAVFAMVAENNAAMRLDLTPDARLFAFTGAIAAATALIFGLAPALRATRVDLVTALKDGSRSVAARGGFARVLVVAQVALSVVMLIGTGLFTRTLYNMKAQDLGYAAERLFLIRLDPTSAGYRGDDIGRVSAQLRDRLAAIPGVTAATFSENGLFSGTESETEVSVEGYTPADDQAIRIRYDQVGPGYFTQVGIPLIAGRDINDGDTRSSARVAVINENMARFYFGDRNPIGRIISYEDVDDAVHQIAIVGVARNARDHSLRADVHRRMYVPFLQPLDGVVGVNFEVRSAEEPITLSRLLRNAVGEVAPRMQVRSIKPLTTLIDESLLNERITARLSLLFGGVAVVLAMIGLYGVLAYSVARRTSEIGVRIAVGARPRRVVWMVLRETLMLVGIGLAIGVPIAVGLGGLVSSLLFGLEPTDAGTIAVAVALMVAVACAAAAAPSRRAAAIDPVRALRYQ